MYTVNNATTESVMNVIPIIERLIVMVLFTQKGREIDNIPPTKDALAQHVLRVGYEAGQVWGQATIKAPQLPNPAYFGWTWEVANAQWNMKWMTLPPAGVA